MSTNLTRTLVARKLRATRRIHLLLAACCLLATLAQISTAQSLRPPRLEDDYIRTTFTVEDGLPDNVINALTETANGLLWVGTDAGLASFDGRQFNPINLHVAGAPAQGAVHSLMESSKGDLWVGTDAGVVLIPRKALTQFDPAQLRFYSAGDARGSDIEVLFEAHDRTIWAGGPHGLHRLRSEQFEPIDETVSVSRIEQASTGEMLLVTGRGFMEWESGKLTPHPEIAASLHIKTDSIFNVMEDRHGTVWFATLDGIARGPLNKPKPFPPFGSLDDTAIRTKEDAQGNMWSIYHGRLMRVADKAVESPAPEIAPRVFWLGEHGDIWIGTNGYGLAHLVRRTVRVFTHADGLPTDIMMSVLTAHDGRLWIGQNCGLTVFDGHQFKSFNSADGLVNGCVTSLAEDQKENLWIGTYGGGVLRYRDNHFTQYSVDQGLINKVVNQVLVAKDGSLWVATGDGVSHIQGTRFVNFTIANGLSSNEVLSIHQSGSGRIWAATQNGIDLFTGDHFIPAPAAPVRPGLLPLAFAEDSLGNHYAFLSPRGISRIQNDHFLNVTDSLNVQDMVEGPHHDLWFSSKNGIYRINAKDLQKSTGSRDEPLDYEWFNRSDGMKSVEDGDGFPNIAMTQDAKLWVATVNGLAMIDLTRLSTLRQPPRVFVGSVTIGANTQLAGSHVVLSAGTAHVEFHLEAVDLASPEKVRIQYRLDGVDKGWLDADVSRTAIYSYLPAGTHAFHVRAMGSDGIWDRQGIVYSVTQRPYLYETSWFHLLLLLAIVLLLSTAYLARMRQVVLQTRIRLEERVVERERISRELHDTLLQGVLSASMQLDVAEERLPDDSPVKPMLGDILRTMRQVVEEGRNALRGLRESGTDIGGIAVALSRIRHELGFPDHAGYRVITTGAARPLTPHAYNEVYRIAREAITNAFVHAHATLIEIELEYASDHLMIVVRDDGRGIPTLILESGRDGHWGLIGMRERAEGMGATLRVRSRLGAGTEVELNVPAASAFEQDQLPSREHWLRRVIETTYRAPTITKSRGKSERD